MQVRFGDILAMRRESRPKFFTSFLQEDVKMQFLECLELTSYKRNHTNTGSVAYSGLSAHLFRQHPPTCTGLSAHL